MDLQRLFEKGMSFEVFAPDNHDVNVEKILEIYNGIKIGKRLINRIKSVDKPTYILAFAELWCTDCIINLPALKKINDINPGIMFKILPKDFDDDYIEEYKASGKFKIPTFIILNDKFEEIGAFVENPRIFNDVISKGSQAEAVVAKRKYQKGEYVNETIEEIVNIITGKPIG